MTGLKTLKDIEPIIWCNGEAQDTLKKEAIKWYNEFHKIESMLETDKVFSYPGGFNYTFGMRCGVVLFLKHFFNIREEDLK